MNDSNETSLKPAVAGDLKPCRSPYCECDQGKCTHPGFYDARGEELPTLQQRAADLRAACETLRHTYMSLAELIPLLQRAADSLDGKIAADLRAACERLRRTPTALSEMIPMMRRAIEALEVAAPR